MKLLKLTQGQFAKVDDADFERVNKYKWFACPNSNGYYAQRTVRIGGKKRKLVKLHRFILGMEDAKIKVDHRDRDGLNCQRSNLRIATDSENCTNATKRKGRKYKGVYKRKYKTKTQGDGYYWIARIMKDGKRYSSKKCNSELEAAIMYNELANRLHGEYACLNEFP